jgi:hypothetical protein
MRRQQQRFLFANIESVKCVQIQFLIKFLPQPNLYFISVIQYVNFSFFFCREFVVLSS